jgi:hypothetical protein
MGENKQKDLASDLTFSHFLPHDRDGTIVLGNSSLLNNVANVFAGGLECASCYKVIVDR